MMLPEQARLRVLALLAAMIAQSTVTEPKGQLLQESGRDCRQGSCRTHHRYLLEKPSADNPLPPNPAPLRNRFPRPLEVVWRGYCENR